MDTNELTEIKNRIAQGKMWNAGPDLRTLAGWLDEALELLDEVAKSADGGVWHSSDDCQAEGRTDCELCAGVARAREFVERLRGAE